MTFANERKWLVIALFAGVLTFERWSVMEVRRDEIVVSHISFWFHKTESKRIAVSDVGDVRFRAVPLGYLPEILIKTKRGKEFFSVRFGFALTAWRRASRDLKLLKNAMASGDYFRRSNCESFWWIVLVIVSLFVYWYKRSWRIHDEREEIHGPFMRSAIASHASTRGVVKNRKVAPPIRLAHSSAMRCGRQTGAHIADCRGSAGDCTKSEVRDS